MKLPILSTICVFYMLPLAVSAGFWGPIVEYVDRYFTDGTHEWKKLLKGLDSGWIAYKDVKAFVDWSGYAKEAENITEAFADIEIPNLLPRRYTEQHSEVAGEAWVGIDGYSCREASLRAGVTWKRVRGRTSYVAWSQWLPMPRTDFVIDIEPSHELRFTVRTSNSTGGVVTVMNHSTNQSSELVYSNQSAPLCRDGAEWIVSRVQKPAKPGQQHENYKFGKYESLRFNDPGYVSESGEAPSQLFDARQLRMGERRLGSWQYSGDSVCKIELLTRDVRCQSVPDK